MSDRNRKQAGNVAGKYYVDAKCIDCDVCRDIAEDNFTRDDKGQYSFVYKQPETPKEETLCQEALECCPVEAIGNDGTAAATG
jgi:ferredoxin